MAGKAVGKEEVGNLRVRSQDGVGIERGSFRPLHLVVRPQDLRTGVAGQEEVAALLQLHVGLLTFDLKDLAQGLEEGDAELRHADVLRRRELLPNRAGRARRGTGLVAGVALNDTDTAVEVRVGCEKVGHSRANHTAAGNHNIEVVTAGLEACCGRGQLGSFMAPESNSASGERRLPSEAMPESIRTYQPGYGGSAGLER